MSSIVIEMESIIHRPAEVVFRNATCLKGCVNWQTTTVSTEKQGDEPTGVGTRFSHVVKFMGVNTHVYPEITVYEPPRAFAYRDTSSPLSFDVHMIFTPIQDGSSTHLQARVEGSPHNNLLGRLALPLITSIMRRQFETDLALLKELLEQDVTVHA